MNAADIAALAAGIPTIIGAITALVVALKARNSAAIAAGTARRANDNINSHIVKVHNQFPIQPPTDT